VPPYREYRDFTEWNSAREPINDRRDRKADDENERVPEIEPDHPRGKILTRKSAVGRCC
jgi:hypothetical protein